VLPADDRATEPGRLTHFPEGERVGPYRLIREIGHGGMGTVYLAVRSDDAFQKRVAIKVLKRGMDTDAIVRRFRNERQILASLEHPYIAGLLDGGTTAEGLPYFAMEYVEGQSIVDFCESRQLDTTARLQLFRKICAAIQHAHQNLIIHRDIKPANVVVTADGTPKLLDFGIAKLLNPELSGQAMAPTVAGPQLMTPEYASPEQVRGVAVTTATDVYSLGVLLYELLTGRRPYRITSRTPAEIARVVCNAEPVRPSTAVTDLQEDTAEPDAPTEVSVTGVAHTGVVERMRTADTDRLRKRLAGDLDNIVLKALSKEPTRRYASVDQFSEDVRRHLAGLPVIARPDTLGYRASKFVRRNRTAVAAALLIAIALVAGTIGTAWQAREARRERARAEQRFDEVRQLANAALFDLHDAIRDLPGSTPARQLLVSKGVEYLDRLAKDAGDRPDLRREMAGAYVKVGDVQGRPFNPNLGDAAGALASYRKAAAAYESLGAATSPDPALRRELAMAYQRLSEILQSTGGTKEALDYAKQSLALLREVSEMSPQGDAAAANALRRELVASHSRVGDMLSASGDTTAALEQRRLAVALMERLAGSEPADPANVRQLGVAYFKLGNQLGNPNYPNVGDTAGALEQLQKSADVFRKAIATWPSNVMMLRNFAIADSALSDIYLALNRPQDALQKQLDARKTFESLSAADPTNATARNDVAISFSKVGEMLDAVGRSAEAVKEFEQALSIHQALSAADPGNDTMKLEVASDYNRLATVQAKVGARDASLANHTRAVDVTRGLKNANASNVELAMALALALGGRADATLIFARKRPFPPTRAADLAAAERDYTESLALLEALNKAGTLQGTDLTTLENHRKELQKIRSERAVKLQ
jgi:non-specific serine/threonine protein kinase/serine/threonine-protein kinase